MAKISSLLLLVNALSKGEKRYLRLYTGLQEGAKDYIYLLGLLEKGGTGEAIRQAFRQNKPKASYEATCKYLYKVIMDCLLQLRTDQGEATKLIVTLLKANILFEKSMYEEGFKQLRKVQAVATEHEQYIIQLWATKLELYYLCNLNFNQVTESELIQKQMKIDELLKYAKNIHQHTSLYELLKHRLVYKGSVRTRKQKEELNDLVVTELNILSKSHAETFESHKTHLLFQANYFITVNDYQPALKAFYELNQLFEENNYLWKNSPVDYISVMEGILDSLHTIHRYDEMKFFLDKMEKMQKETLYFEVTVQRILFIYKIAGFLDRGQFGEAVLLKETFEEKLFKKIHLLDLSKQAEVYLYTALIYIGKGNVSKAHYYLNRILLETKLYYSLPVYRTFRLIHLLVHYELGNYDYIAYEIRSIKRGLNPQTKSYLVEKIVFRFLSHADTSKGLAAQVSLWKKIQKDFEAIKHDKYETQILKIFDFSSWIEAKLCKKSFSELLQKKYETFSDNPD